MKKYIAKILLFFIIVALIDVAFGMGCDYLYKNSKGGDTYKINYAISEGTADVLIMGSSRASHHYNPQILSDSLNMSVYNLGIDGSGVILADGFYRLIAERYKPKYIIYELTPSFDIYQYSGDVNNTRYLSQLKPYYKEECLSGIFEDVNPGEKLKLRSGLYRYNTTFLNLIRFYLRGEESNLRGFAPLVGTMGNYLKEGKQSVSVIDPLKMKYLSQFISDCHNEGTELFFVISPKYGATTSNSYNPAKELCIKKGYDVLDLYCEMQQKKFFNDSYHLNMTGANAFTSLIAHQIKNQIHY